MRKAVVFTHLVAFALCWGIFITLDNYKTEVISYNPFSFIFDLMLYFIVYNYISKFCEWNFNVENTEIPFGDGEYYVKFSSDHVQPNDYMPANIHTIKDNRVRINWHHGYYAVADRKEFSIIRKEDYHEL